MMPATISEKNITIPVCTVEMVIGMKKEGGIFGMLGVEVKSALKENPALGRIFVVQMRRALDMFEKDLEGCK